MTSLLDVFIAVKPDMDKFGPEVKKKLNAIDTKAEGSKVAGRFGVGFNGAFGGIVKHSAGLFVGAFAAIKGVQVLGGFIKDAQESAKVGRISAAVIKSTGGVAHITAAQIGDLATAISNKTGADDEAIQSGENLLATFTNVRNETGKGNDIFNRATQAAVDMAAAMNNGTVDAGGLKTANIQLGKALNDPIKGITALGKAGVSFTAEQKKQIKSYVASGDTLKAQKIILAEVGKEFGGAAAAAADPLTRLTTIGGNLAEQVGGFLLPAVGKFASFLGDTAIPAISELFNLFKTGDFTKEFAQAFGVAEDSGFVDFLFNIRETAISVFTEVTGGFRAFVASFKANDGDITSSGFPGFMERLGFVARQTFDFFKTEVLPRLKDFAGFIIGTVVPAVATLVGNLVSTFQPALVAVFGFIKTEVIPRLQDFAAFLGDKIIPHVAALADGLSKNKDFLVPFAATIVTLIAGLKAWAIIQAILNAELFANPIGLVVLAIAALVGGLIYAYKNSDKFREIVDNAFKVVAAAGKFMWEVILKPTFEFLKLAFEQVWLKAQFFATVTVTAFNALKDPAVQVFRFIVKRMFDFVGGMLNGAAKAFGWVPGIGDKLKNASAEFEKFKDATNRALDGINDEPVNIKVDLAYTQALGQKTKQMKFATGGGVFGAGTATSDSIPAMLSNNEHVWTAKEVQAAGGHKAMESMRKQVVRGYATGGVVVNPLIPSGRRISALTNQAAAGVDATGSAIAKSIARQMVAAQVNPGLSKVLQFVKSQVGKPYVWGGVGPGGYDCSGLISAAVNTAYGRRPYSRLGATGSMPWSSFASGPGAFEVGWFKGNPGHTAATVNGVNIESSGGRGVHMGSGARGARNALFTNRAHVKGFAGGGPVGDAPYDSLHNKKRLMKELGIDLFDKGGRWKSGTLAANMSGSTETVVPGGDVMTVRLSDEDRQLLRDAGMRPITLDGKRLDEQMSRRAMNGGY